ncbi:protein SLC31A2 isoform 2-T2 [Trichechus inunguis]
MQMHFIFSNEVVLLFDFWSVHSPTGMALSVVVILLLAVLYESIKVGKVKLFHHALESLPARINKQLIEETDQESADSDLPPVCRTRLSAEFIFRILKRKCNSWEKGLTGRTGTLPPKEPRQEGPELCGNHFSKVSAEGKTRSG